MLAAVYHGAEDLRVEEVPIPEIGLEEVLIKVESASICGTDLRILKGDHHLYPPGTVRIPGHEVVGRIERAGSGVSGYTVGQKVFIAPNIGCGHCRPCISGNDNHCVDPAQIGLTMDGAFAEYMRLPARGVQRGNLIPVLEGIDSAEASLIEPFACVLRGQKALQVAAGDLVLILGAGPIGILHLKLAQLRGARCVIVSEPGSFRRERIKNYGPNRVVDPNSENLSEVIAKESDGLGADVVIVAAPAHQAQEAALELAGHAGRINFFAGLPRNNPTIGLNSNLVHYKELRITGTSGCSVHDCWESAQIVNSGRVDLSGLITNRFPLNCAGEAFTAARDYHSLKIAMQP